MEKRPKSGYGYIYKYTSPSGSSYIGQTVRSLAERAGHNGKNYKGCDIFYSAIQKYGFENFDVCILAEVKKEQLDDQEKKYIQIFNTLTPNGYNISPGGAKIGRAAQPVYQYSATDGGFIQEWESAQEAATALGLPHYQALQRCLENKTYTAAGYCWSRLKMNKFPINERMVDNHNKRVQQYSSDGKTLIAEYESLSEAARATGAERSAIRRCCRGELNTHHGYKWACSEIIAEKKFNNTPKAIEQLDVKTGGIIQVFPSISAAARSLGKGTSQIRNVLDRDTNTAYGYKWKTHSKSND